MNNTKQSFFKTFAVAGVAVAILAVGISVATAQQSNARRATPAAPALKLPAGARSFTDRATGKTYVALPGMGNRDQQFARAAALVPGKSHAFVPSTVQEFEMVRNGLNFPALDLYAVGIFRLDGAPKKEPKSYWTTVTGEPILINESIWNPSAPNNGCVKKPKPSFQGGKLVLDNGPHCKNEYSCGIYNALGGSLPGRLEDLGRGATFRGVIVEINR